MSAPVPWRDMTHEQLYAAVNAGPGPGISMPAEQTWRAVHEIIEAGEARMAAAVKGSGEGWQGSAGDAARSGFHELNSWARDAAMDAHNTVAAMIEQGVSSGRLRSSLPAPNTEQLVVARDAARNAFDQPAYAALQEAEAEATWRDESARRAMMQYHFHSGDNRQLMDYWAVPPTVLVEAGPAGGPGSTGAGPGAGGAGQVPAGLGAAAISPDGAGGPVGGNAAGGAGPGGVGGAGAGAVGAGPAGGSGSGGVGLGSPAGGGSAGGGPVVGGPVVGGATGGGAAGGGSAGSGSGAGRIGAALGPGATGSAPGGAGGAGRAGGATPGGGGSGVPAGTAPPIRGPRDLPAGAGGRGTGPIPGAVGSTPGGGVRPVAPRVPTPAAPSPTWRDVVASQRGEAGGLSGRPGDVASGPRGPGGGGFAGGGPGGAGPGSGWSGGGGSGGGAPGGGTGSGTGLRGPAEAGGRTGAGGHAMYPPMGGGGVGNQGEERRRVSYLLDDTGAFDVDLPCVEPVIGANIPPSTTRTRGDAGV